MFKSAGMRLLIIRKKQEKNVNHTNRSTEYTTIFQRINQKFMLNIVKY